MYAYLLDRKKDKNVRRSSNTSRLRMERFADVYDWHGLWRRYRFPIRLGLRLKTEEEITMTHPLVTMGDINLLEKEKQLCRIGVRIIYT